jgi:hypothetical protein
VGEFPRPEGASSGRLGCQCSPRLGSRRRASGMTRTTGCTTEAGVVRVARAGGAVGCNEHRRVGRSSGARHRMTGMHGARCRRLGHKTRAHREAAARRGDGEPDCPRHGARRQAVGATATRTAHGAIKPRGSVPSQALTVSSFTNHPLRAVVVSPRRLHAASQSSCSGDVDSASGARRTQKPCRSTRGLRAYSSAAASTCI